MDWRSLELLRCVVDSGSFTEAARVAGVSQPAVSQAMLRLTRQVGEPLFETQGRRRIPTTRAIELAQAARAADDRLRAARPGGRSAAGPAPERLVRVGLAPAAGLLYGPSMVHALAGAGRRFKLSIITGPAPVMLGALQRGELDLVIAPRPRGTDCSGLRECLMYVSQPVIYCREGHPLASARSLREIARASWVVAGWAGTPGNMVEEAFRVRRWTPPQIAVQCADYAMLVEIIAGSDLLGVISHPRLVPQPRQLGIVPLHIDEGLPHYDVCLFWPRRIARNGTVIRQLVAALTEGVESEAQPPGAAPTASSARRLP